MAGAKKQLSARIPPDMEDRLSQYCEDHDIKPSDATRRLLDEGLERRGYRNGDRASPTRTVLRESGKGTLYFAAGGIAAALWLSSFHVATMASLFMIAGAALLALSLHGDRIDSAIRGVLS